MGDSMEPNELNERIVEIVEQHWDDQQMPLLLSRLGGHDRGEIARLARQHANSLGAYLRQELGDRLQVIKHSERPVLIGVLPLEAESQADVDGWLESAQGKSASGAPRYHPAFWAAFRKPLDEMKSRFISVTPPIRFQDAYPEDAPAAFVEIGPEYIADSEMDAGEVLQNAQDWLEENNLQSTAFLALSSGEDRRERRGQAQVADNLLDRLIDALDPSELKRVSMSLDVVVKLRRQSG